MTALLGLHCGSPSEESLCGPTLATVTRVIDGDTIELANGDHVRYLLVNTPEITMGKNDCYGEEAKEYNRQLVLDQEVALTYDQQCQDRYGRWLAYVAVQGREVNTLLVQRGYACVLYIAPDGQDRRQEFETMEFEARSLKKGLWAACADHIPCQ
jgi:micrococcal nuclease